GRLRPSLMMCSALVRLGGLVVSLTGCGKKQEAAKTIPPSHKQLRRPSTPIPASSPIPQPKPPSVPSAPKLTGIHKIQHVAVIFQENRSFDSYFGTYPGADGLPIN